MQLQAFEGKMLLNYYKQFTDLESSFFGEKPKMKQRRYFMMNKYMFHGQYLCFKIILKSILRKLRFLFLAIIDIVFSVFK